MALNKRAKMALNRSPELTSLNPKPSAAELFGTLVPFFLTNLRDLLLAKSGWPHIF